MITQKMSLESMKNGIQETVYAKKGERAARTLSITLTSGGKVLNIAGYLVRVVFPDQTVLNLSNTNPVQFTIPQTLCASPGEYVCELQLRNAYNTEIFYSPMFRVIVEDSLTVTEPAQQIGEDVSYVEAETGKSLMTDAERAKLAGIEDGAEVNPTNVSAFTNDAGYQNAAQVEALISDRVTKMLPLEFTITAIGVGDATGTCNYSDTQIYQAIQDGKALQIVKLKDSDGEWIEGFTDFLQGEFLSFVNYGEYIELTFVSDSNLNGVKPKAFFEISGNSVTIYTEGEKVLPDATSSDEGKVPIVNSGGIYELGTVETKYTEIWDHDNVCKFTKTQLVTMFSQKTPMSYQGHPVFLARSEEEGSTVNVYYLTSTSSAPKYNPTIYRISVDGSKNIVTDVPTRNFFSGNYNDLSNKPTIPTVPTNVSAFNNDAGYLTAHQDISGKENKGKMTLNNVEETVVTHTLSVTDGGVTTTYTLLGV